MRNQTKIARGQYRLRLRGEGVKFLKMGGYFNRDFLKFWINLRFNPKDFKNTEKVISPASGRFREASVDRRWESAARNGGQ